MSQIVWHNVSEAMSSPEFTYSYDKYSCIREMYVFHIFCAYGIMVTGLLALISRVVPYIKFMHLWLGRAYIHFMLWCTATALLINNTGLPVTVILSFAYVMGGLSIGWIAINIHQMCVQQQALKNVQEAIKTSESNDRDPLDLAAAIGAEKARMAADKTWTQRVFSLKALHGAVFFTSWLNIAGRIFATPLDTSGWVCYTYPVYKPFDSEHFQGAGETTLTPVPIHDPDYARLPWAKTGDLTWTLLLSVGSMAACYIFGAIFSFAATWSQRKRSANVGGADSIDQAKNLTAPL